MALVAQPRGERSQIRPTSDEAMVRVPAERLKLGLEDACGRSVVQGCPDVRGELGVHRCVWVLPEIEGYRALQRRDQC